jgi:hypothetical protein
MFQLSIAALVIATLFAGAALYISLVEHPARLGLADGPLLAQWQPSYKRALPIQSGLAVSGGLVGLTVGYLSADWRWLRRKHPVARKLAIHAAGHHAS